jgi:hypothetical protein
MAVGSNVNPNYPIPGIDQSSKGFRDNFSAIKVEIENLQSKNIVLTGDATGNAIIDGGTGDVVIHTVVNMGNIAAAAPDRSVQFNNAGTLGGDPLLYWDPVETLVIGSQTPDLYYWLDSGQAKIHDELLVFADTGGSTIRIASSDMTVPELQLSSQIGYAYLSVSDQSPLLFINNGNTAAILTEQGLAVGSMVNPPSNRLEVFESAQSNIALMQSTLDNSDNTVRLETVGANSTMGLALQQTAADSVVGMRISQTGNLTLHTGLNNGAYLDDSSIVVQLDSSGRMGIGINQPQFRLDIDGGLQHNLPGSANVAPYGVDQIGVVVDSWDVTVYRSADYTVQVLAADGSVEISKVLVMHSNGLPYQNTYGVVNTGSTLGLIVASIDGSIMQLIYAGTVDGNTVKVDATYITL